MGRKKRGIAVADAETDPFEWGITPEPFVWGFYDGDQYEQFWSEESCSEQFVEFIQDKHVYLYVHNGGRFDFYYLLPFIDPSVMMIKQRIAECTLGEAKLRDSYLILPLPLSAHKKDEIEYWKLKKEYRNKYRAEIERYLYHDCLYLYDWVIKYTERFGTKLTLPAAAMAQLKATDYQVPKTNSMDDAKFRPFYFGGRTQAFKTGRFDGPIDYYDINSAYPYAMLHKHPRGRDCFILSRFPNNNAPYLATVDAISHGAFPYRAPDGSLIFPDDNEVRTYHVTSWEVQAGLDTGTVQIRKVHRCYIFTDTANFSDYVNKFYGEKLEAKKIGDKDTELFAKLFLNSAYGKFGQDARKFKAFEITDQGECPSECREDYRKFLGAGYDWIEKEDGTLDMPEGVDDEDLMITRGWYKVNETETDHVIWEKDDPGDKFFNVATAASITGFVRAYLWRAICRSREPLYVDTDSIMSKRFDGPIGDELGQWTREATLQYVWIGGKKLYAALTDEGEWKVASKGARLEPLQIQRIVENRETVRWSNIAPSFSLTQGTRWIARDIRMTG